MTRPAGHYVTGDGYLPTNCTCERSIVFATPAQVWDGTPLTCGRPSCPGDTVPVAPDRSNPNRRRRCA